MNDQPFAGDSGRTEFIRAGDGTVLKRLREHEQSRLLSRRRFNYEMQITALVTRDAPVRVARLIASNPTRFQMQLEEVDGVQLDEKFATQISSEDVSRMLSFADRLEAFRPTDSFVCEFSARGELRRRERSEVIDRPTLRQIASVVDGYEWATTFAHGDFTARNFLSTFDGLVLIDWEFAGWFPKHYDRAHLWVTLVNLPELRNLVQPQDTDQKSFWLNACLVLLEHFGRWQRNGLDAADYGHHRESFERAVHELLSCVYKTTPERAGLANAKADESNAHVD